MCYFPLTVELEKTNSSQRPLALLESEIQVNADKQQKTEPDDSIDSKADSNKLSSVAFQEPEVKKKKIKVSPVSKIKRKSVATVKKIHKNIAGSFARVSTVKSKKLRDQPRKSVKERLGRAPVYQPRVPLSPESEESESESGSGNTLLFSY